MVVVTTVVATDPAASSRQTSLRLTLAGIVLCITVVAVEALAVATVMPTVVRSLHGVHWYGWSFTAYLLADVVGMVDSGWRSDARGPRTSLVGGLLFFAAGLVVDGIAPDMLVFTIGRVLQGLGGGAMIVAIYVLVARVFPDDRRPRVLTAMSAAWVVPAFVGPSIAGAVADAFGWRWVFIGVAVLSGVGAAMLAPVVRESGRGGNPGVARVGTRGGVALAGGLALWQVAGQRLDWTSPLFVVAGLALLAVPLRRLLPRGALRLSPGLPTVIWLRGLLSTAFFGAEAYLPLTLARLHNGSPTVIGVPLTVAAVGWAGGSWWQGRAVAAARPGRLLAAGFVIVAVSVASLVTLTFTDISLWAAAPLWGLGGLGMGLAYPVVSIVTMRLSPAAEQGANASAVQVCDVMGSILGIAVDATLVTSLGVSHLGTAMRIADPVLAVVAVAGLFVSRRAIAVEAA